MPGFSGFNRQEAPVEPRPGIVSVVRNAGSSFFGREAPAEPRSGIASTVRDAGTSFLRTPSFLGGEEQEDFTTTLCPSLTIRQRMIGFAACLGIGLLLEFGSFGRLMQILRGRPEKFAFLYTLGNMLALASTFFLAGPQRQCRRMMRKKRWVASLVYVSSILCTFFVVESSAKFHGKSVLIILLIAVQWCAIWWYILSYIPYGRQLMARACEACCARCCGR